MKINNNIAYITIASAALLFSTLATAATSFPFKVTINNNTNSDYNVKTVLVNAKSNPSHPVASKNNATKITISTDGFFPKGTLLIDPNGLRIGISFNSDFIKVTNCNASTHCTSKNPSNPSITID